MDHDEISRHAHADHPIAAPLDDDAVRRLLERGLPRGAGRVLDLGCGGGEWLLRARGAHDVRAEAVVGNAQAPVA
ncbi:SAM-dependent methyltransferase, partial [Streptomyces sp. NPDC051132]